MAEHFRYYLATAFLIFLLAWFGFVAFLYMEVGINGIEGLGLGTVSGVFLKAFSDMWQFFFRKSGPKQPELPKV